MKKRSKIIIILICSGLLLAFISSYIFEIFFKNYLENLEIDQVSSISKGLDTYLNEKTDRYQASISDWSQWDDTYNYINDKYPTYIEENLMEYDFENLSINFFIIIEADNLIKVKQFYDFENKEFTDVPKDFDFENIMQFSKHSINSSGIFVIGKQYYFVAISDVTDSLKEKSNGKLIFGRMIDSDLIYAMEELSNSKITISNDKTISSEVSSEIAAIKNSSGELLNLIGLKFEKNTMQIEFIIKNDLDDSNPIQLTLLKSRDLYTNGLNHIEEFRLIYIIGMMLFILLSFILLVKYISKPLIMLINDVKDIDITKGNVMELEMQGTDEFSFLRQTINSLLNSIEKEQSIVREGEKKLQLTLNSVGDAVITVDSKGNIDYMNPIAEQLTGWKLKDAYGNSFENVFDIINEHTREKVESPIKKVFEIKEIIELANHTLLVSKDGNERAIEDTAAPILNDNDELIGVVLVFRDFSEKKEKNQRIEYLSYHDVVTGLYNRRFFEQELVRLDTNRNLPLSIVYADVNGLKIINDTFGHQYGDLLIQKVADVFKNECRADDIISRTGGDEFIVLLPKTSTVSAEILVKRIQEKIEQEMIMDINLSVSFGWDTKELEGKSIWDVMMNSEELMYQTKLYSKSSKRNTFIRSILNKLFTKSTWEENHSKIVSELCAEIGKAYNLSDIDVNELRLAGEFHDIGKISINECILNKPDRLTISEKSQIHGHPETGYRLLATSSEFYKIAEYVRSHHEKWDGTGYPNGLIGNNIDWNSRVISIAEAYCAMTSYRTYSKVFTREEAAEEIKKNSGTQFDPDIARVFVEKVLGITW